MAKRRRRRKSNPGRRARRVKRRMRSNPVRILGFKPLTLGLLALGGWWLWKRSQAAKAAAAPILVPVPAAAASLPAATGDDAVSVSGIFESAGGHGSLG